MNPFYTYKLHLASGSGYYNIDVDCDAPYKFILNIDYNIYNINILIEYVNFDNKVKYYELPLYCKNIDITHNYKFTHKRYNAPYIYYIAPYTHIYGFYNNERIIRYV